RFRRRRRARRRDPRRAIANKDRRVSQIDLVADKKFALAAEAIVDNTGKPVGVLGNGVEFAAFFDYVKEEEHSVFFPANVLFFVEKGQLNFKIEQELRSIPAQSFALVRKYTYSSMFKSWAKEEGSAVVYALALHDELLKDNLQEFRTVDPDQPIQDKLLPIQDNQILRGLFKSLSIYLDEAGEVDTALVRLKIREALLGITKNHPEYISLFASFSQSEKADLRLFLEHNYLEQRPLEELAKLSGRSLSTFHRECKAIYGIPPHRWIMKRRLQRAKELMLVTHKTASQIYLDVGFEDLSHFSRAFKKEFGKTPTQMKNMVK
ncbi:MAG: AraC family transcriptional regulator, partial [Bacteroidota bacterium]